MTTNSQPNQPSIPTPQAQSLWASPNVLTPTSANSEGNLGSPSTFTHLSDEVFNQSKQSDQPAAPANNPVYLSDQQLQQLAGFLQQSVQPPQPTQSVQPQTPPVEPSVMDMDTKSKEFKDLSDQFKKVTGVDLGAAIEGIQQQLAQIQPIVQQSAIQQVETQLKSIWNVSDAEYRQRVSAVQEVASKLSPEDFQRYDKLGVDGVDLIYQRFIANQQRPQPPVFDRANMYAPQSGTKQLTPQELSKMLANGSAQNNWGEVLAAYANMSN